MSQSKLETRMLRIDEIRPNPFQPRETFAREDIEDLANTIRKVGLLQPISVRKQGNTYQIIAGERRWRASQFANLKEIPAIIKDASDSQMMIESLIENVNRKDLEPIEKARGLAEVYRLSGFEPVKTMSALTTLDGYSRERLERQLTKDEETIKDVADNIGLSYDYQYRLLSQLRLTPEEQKRATELKLSYGKISSISSIEDKEDRREMIEIAPDLEVGKVEKVSKLIRKAPKSIKKALLKREIEPEIADEILTIKEPEIQEKALQIAKTGAYTPIGMKTRIEQLTRPRIVLPTESLEDQIFNKTLWNLSRIDDYDFYTVGYEKRTFEQFLRILKAKKVATLVDVRRNPVSQYREEFNKAFLDESMRKNNVTYVHRPELGVPSEVRRKLEETGDYDWFFKEYDRNTAPELNKLNLKDFTPPVAFMCVELDPTRCHRHRIALELEKRGCRGYDL
jgi:ParB-like chromosome segregation protein Spo0J